MYNDTRYSLARYSVKEGNREIAVEERFSEALGALAGAAVPVDIREIYAETCQGAVCGTVSMITLFAVQDSLSAAVRMSANVILHTALAETAGATAAGCKNTPAGLDGREVLTVAVQAAKDIHTRLALTNVLSASTAGSKDIYLGAQFSEVFSVLPEATLQTTEQAVFQLTIPPGGELRIDSGLFLVMLNGENALHTQSGDWVDVSRELLRLTIESATGGGLEGQLIYTERFL